MVVVLCRKNKRQHPVIETNRPDTGSRLPEQYAPILSCAACGNHSVHCIKSAQNCAGGGTCAYLQIIERPGGSAYIIKSEFQKKTFPHERRGCKIRGAPIVIGRIHIPSIITVGVCVIPHPKRIHMRKHIQINAQIYLNDIRAASASVSQI